VKKRQLCCYTAGRLVWSVGGLTACTAR